MVVLSHVTPGPEREALGFVEAVRSSFQFLESYGLRIVEQKSTCVRYESPSVFVNVYHGRASYELDVEIGRMTEPARWVALGEILVLADAPELESRQGFCVLTRERVREFVPKLADLFRRYAGRFLRCDAAVYQAAWQARSTWSVQYEKHVKLRIVRYQAELARQEKRFAKLVELYESIGDDLTEVEVRRLAYARKKIRT